QLRSVCGTCGSRRPCDIDGGSMLMTLSKTTILFATVVPLTLAIGASGAAGQDAAAVKRGQEVYTAQKCQVCHAIAGKGGKANPYAGLVVLLAIPALFVAGLVLIPVGVRLRHRQLQRDTDAVADWPVVDFRRVRVRRTVLLVAALTAVNIVILLVAGYGSLHWMESPGFCGQVCHAPMHPQFTAWSSGPHARIACVACHIGEGPGAFVHAKLNGVRQLMHVATNSYP